MKNNTWNWTRTSAACLCSLCATVWTGCDHDDPGQGTLVVSVASEETITEGLMAGTGMEHIADGWDVSFDKYAIAIGELHLLAIGSGGGDHDHDYGATDVDAEEIYVVDLTQVPEAGLELWEFPGLRAGRWNIEYHIGGAGHGAERHSSVSQADFDRMVDDDLTYLLVGELTKTDGRSCPPPALASPGTDAVSVAPNAAGVACFENTVVHFDLGVEAETLFGPCEIDGIPGVSIPRGGVQTAALTIHGDHMFFNGFPTGSEGGVTRLAQWLADADLNVDGTVTQAELEAITLSDLSEIDSRYQLTGTGLADGTAWDYLIAQLKTQGHLNGEGECAVDGEAHDH